MKNLIFLAGSDTFRSQLALQTIIERYRKVNGSNLGVERLVADELVPAHLAGLVGSGSLFSQKRLVILSRLLSEGKPELRQAVLELLPKLSSDVLLIIYEPNQPDRRLELTKKILQLAGTANIFTPLKSNQLIDYLLALGPRRGWVLTPAAANLLVNRLGNQLQLLVNELDRLALLAGGAPIAPAQIEQFSVPTPQSTAFALSDTLVAGRLKAALTIIDEQLQLGVVPQLLVGSLGSLLRSLALLVSAHGDSQLIAETKLHPFVVAKLSRYSHTLSPQSIRRAYQVLTECDKNIKTGIMEYEVALDLCLSDLVIVFGPS